MIPLKYHEQLKLWDEWIRAGQASKVRALCRGLNQKKIPRSLLIEYAQIARRVGASDLIVLWLRPIVRAEKVLALPASDAEKAIYGLGLLRLGAFHEATRILSEVDPTMDSQVYFYRASLKINQWNYAGAIPDLKKYIRHPKTQSYSKFVGRLNLCAAYVSGESKHSEKAGPEIEVLWKRLQKGGSDLLKGNILEIRSQWWYEQGNTVRALEDLEHAARLLHKADTRSLLYVKKWRAIIKLRNSRNQLQGLRALAEVQVQARILEDWETVRDCDLQKALALHDRELILRVFWGSKFEAYKKRIRRLYGELVVADRFYWTHDSTAPGEILDLVPLAPTPKLRQLFFVLTRELYRPVRTTEIIDSLEENHFYDPFTSPARLHRLVARARTWLHENKFPVEIVSYRNAFQLRTTAACQLLLWKEFPSAEPTLPAVTTQEYFTSSEWARERGVSERSARREILRLVRKGLVRSLIRGRKTKYRLK